MRRHRHNLKPEQQTKLEAYFDPFPALREIYRFKQKLCYLLLKSIARGNSAPNWSIGFWKRCIS